MSKYIIELDENAKEVVVISLEDGDMWTETMEVEDLEQLNSDYINEHFGDLQDDAYNKGYAQCQDDYGDALKHAKDTAYKKGLHDGESKCGYCNEYQRGLNEAWEAARKIVCDEELDWNTLLHLFNRGNFEGIFGGFSPSEAIAKLKSYKEKQKAEDKIKVGDEVEWDNDFTGDRFIVTRIYQPYGKKEQCDGIDDDGDVYRAVLIESLVKTGRHFDIASILEDMKK